MNKFRWPLAVDTFTLADKLRIAKWVLTTQKFTMGPKVEEFERLFSEFSGMYALGVSSGSTANQLVFELWKLRHRGEKALVIAPAVTWISSVSPAIMAGMDVVFCDVNLNDLSFDYAMLEKLLQQYRDRKVIIWPTALIGFSPNMARLDLLAKQYGADLFMDSCENTLSQVGGKSILASCDMTTTSCYFSHQVVACEFGFLFTRSQADYDIAKMLRNHGLTRSLSTDHLVRRAIESFNPEVDPQFLFALNGTNLRPTDVHAMFGLQDFKRIEKSRKHRDNIYHWFYSMINPTRFYLPPLSDTHVGFCLPIFTKGDNLPEIKEILTKNGIEVRPIIGGHLGYQPALKHLFEQPIVTHYPNAEWIHRHGCYVGLHKDVTPDMVGDLADLLNSA